MHRHRFADQMTGEERLEQPRPATGAFVVCPLALPPGWQTQGCPWQHVYQMAFEQAKAVVRPSLLERFQANSWN